MEQGKTKPIGKIEVGDKVEAADPATGKDKGPRQVTAKLVNHDNDLIDVDIRDANGKTATLHTTSKHPFWDATAKDWVPAGMLKVGHGLTTDKGQRVTLAAIRTVTGAADMHNLTVAELHTYYVLVGSNPVLVHNTCPTAAALRAAPSPDNAGFLNGAWDQEDGGESRERRGRERLFKHCPDRLFPGHAGAGSERNAAPSSDSQRLYG